MCWKHEPEIKAWSAGLLRHYLSGAADPKNHRWLKDKPIALFHLMAGPGWNRELMVVGRATNGLEHCGQYTASSLKKVEDQEQFVDRALGEFLLRKRNPIEAFFADMDSREGYSRKKSQFWRVTKQLADKLSPGPEAHWKNTVAWSNLYKIAPPDGGNPSDPMCRAQHEACLDLLGREIGLLKPKRLLFMTDKSWLDWKAGHRQESFFDRFRLEARYRENSDIQVSANVCIKGHRVSVVVTPHPQHGDVNETELIGDVCQEFNRLG